jgi:hypothetical protein
MPDVVKLVDKISCNWRVSDDKQNALLQRVKEDSPNKLSGTESASIGVTFAVKTFVARKNLDNFVMPSFAAHWGVVCDFRPDVDVRLFHLLYSPESREISFRDSEWRPSWDIHEVKHVGRTAYSFGEVSKIGKRDPKFL